LTTIIVKLGFTALAIKISNDIWFDIYSKNWKSLIKQEYYIAFNDFWKYKDINEIENLKLGSFFIENFSRAGANLPMFFKGV
jgi:hypothetical protein